MPRSSRHKSRRSRKRSRDRSVSDVEEEPAASSGARAWRDLEPRKRRSPPAPEGKEGRLDVDNGDVSREQARKRKERAEEASDTRWNGSEKESKRTKDDGVGTPQLDKSSMSKHAAADSKGRSSGKQDGSSERIDENVAKVDSAKRKQEKESTRAESSTDQYKGVKERRDRLRGSERDKERDLERDKKRGGSERDKSRSEKGRDGERDIYDADNQRSEDTLRRKFRSEAGNSDEDNERKDIKFNEVQTHDMIPNPEFEKGLEKWMRRDDSEQKHRGTDVGKLSSVNDHSKRRSYRDERHEDGKSKNKIHDNLDRDKIYRDDKHPGEHSLMNHASDRSGNKYLSDDIKLIDNQYRKSKKDRDHDGGPCPDDCDVKQKDNWGRKMFSCGIENHSESRHSILKDPHEHVEKSVTVASRIESRTDKPRPEYQHLDKLESSPRNHQKSSGSSMNVVKDHVRHSSKQAETAHKKSPSEERYGASVASSLYPGTQSDKVKLKAEIGEFYMETSATVKYGRDTRLDAHTLAIQKRERSPSTSGRRFSERTDARRSLDTEIAQRSNNSKDGDRGQFPLKKETPDDASQTQVCNRESRPAGSSANQTSQLSGGSPNHLPPIPPMRLGTDSPSVLGSYEDDNRSEIDRKSYRRSNRYNDLGFVRGHGNAWKNAPIWPSPMGNGFIPLQHGAPSAEFHPPGVHFHGTPLFSVRAPLDFAHGGISYDMHGMADSFHGHGRPFAWHNAVDHQRPQQMHSWLGSNSAFVDESHMYERSGWNQNKHFSNTRGWEMGTDMWKGQSRNINVDSVVFKRKTEESGNPPVYEIRVLGRQSGNEMKQSEVFPTESTEENCSSDFDLSTDVESSQKPNTRKVSEVPNASDNGSSNFGVNYLSKIDISPVLADSESFKRCTTLLGALDISSECTSISHDHSQKNKDNNTGKNDITRQIVKSLFSTTKNSIFQRAVLLYKEQKRCSILKFPITQLVCSTEQNESLLVSNKGKIEDTGQQAYLEKPSLPDDEPAGNMDAIQFTAVSGEVSTDYPIKADLKVSDLGEIPTCESLMEECKMNLSRIPNPTC